MEKILEKIKKSGKKLTKPRLAVLKVLSMAKLPLSSGEIHKKLKAVNLASVYRSVNLFKSLGLVQTESFGSEEKYCLAHDPHHHIICENCGYTESVHCDHKFKHKNFADIKHRLTLTGVCKSCR